MKSSRRGFIRGLAGLSAVGAGGCFTFGGGNRIRLAAVGVGGKGFSDWLPMIESGRAVLVALCDADRDQLLQAQARLNKLKKPFNLMQIPFYQDYRVLMDDIADGRLKVDAMTVSTPDHAHAAIAVSAMKLGIHVYVQKPLVRTLWELQYFRRTAIDNGVVTQMGNQLSASDFQRRITEVLQSGILGDVKELHVWTDRPIWPQGLKAAESTKGPAMRVPKLLNWDVWLGVAENRPYRGRISSALKGYDPTYQCANTYHPFSWRAFYDFGVGAFGDMACHLLNLPFRGLELGVVTKSECVFIEEMNDISFPTKSIVKMTYAARDSKIRAGVRLPECDLYWYDGNHTPPADLLSGLVAKTGSVPGTGCYIIGSKGTLYNGSGTFIRLAGEKEFVKFVDHEKVKTLPRSIPYRSEVVWPGEFSNCPPRKKAGEHYVEFLDAISGIGPVFEETGSRCYCDVEYSIPIMEGILVGCMAQRVPGVLKWDSANQRFDVPAANGFIKPYIREGFKF